MNITTTTVNGQLGRTVCYTIPWTATASGFSWSAWRFYTPGAPEVDNDRGGARFFPVEAGEVAFTRDAVLDKQVLVIVTEAGVEQVEILEGADVAPITIGLEGDIVANAYISANPEVDVLVSIKEVLP